MKEYRVRQQVTFGPYKGEWAIAFRPNSGKLIHPFYTLEDAQNWIAAQPDWYAKYNKQLPPELRLAVPPYRIEVREVTPWEAIEQ